MKVRFRIVKMNLLDVNLRIFSSFFNFFFGKVFYCLFVTASIDGYLETIAKFSSQSKNPSKEISNVPIRLIGVNDTLNS